MAFVNSMKTAFQNEDARAACALGQVAVIGEADAAPEVGPLKDALIEALAKGQVFVDSMLALSELVDRCEDVCVLSESGDISEELLLNLFDAMPGTIWMMSCFLGPVTSSLRWPELQRFRVAAGIKPATEAASDQAAS